MATPMGELRRILFFITESFCPMKTFLTMTAVVIAGVALTTAIALARIGTPLTLTPPTLDLPAESNDSPSVLIMKPNATIEQGAQPRAVVDDDEFDFGNMRNKTMDNSHTFTVRNEGDAPLVFTGSSVSCNKCTFVDLPEKPVEPGESVQIVVRWNVDTYEDFFRQSATVKTNDPYHDALRFVITGKVVRPLQVEPQKLVASNIQVGEPASLKATLSAYFSEDLQIVDRSFGEPATAEYFAVDVTQVPKDRLAEGVKSALEVTVNIKPGLPVGSILQTLHLKTNIEDEPETTVPISGDVVGAVQVYAKGWERELKFLNIGNVKQSQGDKRSLNLMMRGENLTDLKLDPAQVDESVLKVTYGDVVVMKEGTGVRVPVVIEIPPGSPLVNHMGGTAKLAEIIVPTNKPALGRVKLSVKFAVVAD
ncbi:MAG TPA: DUF1573 domain-containing protein [Pirellulales bacterium]|nr:DUF1573 domain-containing protein [Pirellulales bacterium]